MASDKIDHQGVGAIAQAMKHQARTGAGWDDLSAAAKESIDQILSSIARTVSTGQGAHWDGIMAYADAAKPTTNNPMPPITGNIERDILGLVRAIPRNSDG